MKNLIKWYLLFKARERLKFVTFDIFLAIALAATYDEAPFWLMGIANLKNELPLPEAWAWYKTKKL